MAKGRINIFLIVIYHYSLVKGAMNAARLCKLRNGVKKCLNFFFFQWPKVDQVGNEYSPQLSIGGALIL
jgi:hypothetical protein